MNESKNKKRNLETFEFTRDRSRKLRRLSKVLGKSKKETVIQALELLESQQFVIL
jgi:hypothetical protein